VKSDNFDNFDNFDNLNIGTITSQMALRFSVDLTRYKGVCPSCESKLEGQDNNPTNENYEFYINSSKKRFGDNSLPLCYHCWCNNAELCEGCALPFCIAFSNELGGILMRKTTMTSEAKGKDHICVKCVNK
jgi:hypothetical protein